MSWADIVQESVDTEVRTTMPPKISMSAPREAAVTNIDHDWKPFAPKRKLTQSNGTNGIASPNGVNGINGTHSHGSSDSTTSSHEEKDKRIQELEAELVKKDHYTAELVAQIDEKDRRVNDLEAQVTSQRQLIASLENKVETLNSQLKKALAKTSTESSPENAESCVDNGPRNAPVEDRVANLEDHIKALTLQINGGKAAPVESSLDREIVLSEKQSVTAQEPDKMAQNVESPAEELVEESQDNQLADLKHDDAPDTGNAGIASAASTEISSMPVKSARIDEQESPPKVVQPASDEPTEPHRKVDNVASVELVESKELMPKPEVTSKSVASAGSPQPSEDSSKKVVWGTGDGANDPAKHAKSAKNVPPPAPKLSFPIKKLPQADRDEKTKAWVNQPVNTSGASGKWSFGDSDRDLRDMSLAERSTLFRGPSVNILVGNETLRGFSRNMFMAASPKIRNYFTENPNETYIAFPAGSIAVPVLNILRDYFRAMGTQKTVFSLKLRYNWQQDLVIRRDCCYLGMDKYVAHFTRQYCDKVREGFLSHENIGLIVKNTNDDDPLFNCLANNLAVLRRRGNIPDPEKFEEFLKHCPRLAQAIGSIETRIQADREKRRAMGANRNANGGRSRTPTRQPGRSVNGSAGRLGSPPTSYAGKLSAKPVANGV